MLVKLTPAGRETFDELRSEYRALLQKEMEGLSDRDVAALARAVEILDTLAERPAHVPASPALQPAEEPV